MEQVLSVVSVRLAVGMNLGTHTQKVFIHCCSSLMDDKILVIAYKINIYTYWYMVSNG